MRDRPELGNLEGAGAGSREAIRPPVVFPLSSSPSVFWTAIDGPGAFPFPGGAAHRHRSPVCRRAVRPGGDPRREAAWGGSLDGPRDGGHQPGCDGRWSWGRDALRGTFPVVSPEAVGSPRRRRGSGEPPAWSAQGAGGVNAGWGGRFRIGLELCKVDEKMAFFSKTR